MTLNVPTNKFQEENKPLKKNSNWDDIYYIELYSEQHIRLTNLLNIQNNSQK